MSPDHHPVVDFGKIGRRLRTTALVVGPLTVTIWLVTGVMGDGPTLRGLLTWLGPALAVMFVAEVVVVGGSAVRGMLRAGARGDRLAQGDVGLLPPQLTRRGRAQPQDAEA